MKKELLVFFLAGSVMLAGCAGGRKMTRTFSGEPGEIVEAEGVAPIVKDDQIGARTAALADAQKSAVELVVGVYISAKTMVEKAVTIQSNVLAKTEGYITRYDILKEGKDGAFYKVRIKALVKLADINKDLEALGLLVKPEEAGNPRVSIIIEEEIDGEVAESGDAETTLFQSLIDLGYPVVESTQLSDQEVDSALGGESAFYRSIGEKLKIEILIIGNVAATLVTKEGLGGFISYRASANLKAIRCADGKILVTATEVQSGVDITPGIAAAKALKEAAKKGGEKIANDLAARIRQTAVIAVSIEGLSSLQELKKIQNFLDGLVEVKSTQVRRYAAGKADIDVYQKSGTTQDIAGRLSSMKNIPVEVQSVTAYDISIKTTGE